MFHFAAFPWSCGVPIDVCVVAIGCLNSYYARSEATSNLDEANCTVLMKTQWEWTLTDTNTYILRSPKARKSIDDHLKLKFECEMFSEIQRIQVYTKMFIVQNTL